MPLYAIVDIETTGGGYNQDHRITDISVFVFDGQQVVKEFHSLVNPETTINYFITKLTGITNDMVKDAPKFYQIAKDIVRITEGCTFVAHNVSFDYGVISQEFASLGYKYEREKLCTVKLSRKLIPGHPSYSLGKICEVLSIPIEGRHRAFGDAKATLQLFRHLLDLDAQRHLFTPQPLVLPLQLDPETIKNLPEQTGVYYFLNSKKEVIYVGKSVNIKQRVLSHFRDKTSKEVRLCEQTYDIQCHITGSELIALLKESAEIKALYPFFNRSQKRLKEVVGLIMYENSDGIVNLALQNLKQIANPITSFYNTKEARSYLQYLCDHYQLCPKYCGLEAIKGRCFNSQIKKCKGVCCGKETPEEYNKRVQKALDSVDALEESMVIAQEGAHADELGYVLVHNATYLGYGFIDKNADTTLIETFRANLVPQTDNRDVKKIISRYIKSNKTILILKPKP